MTYLANLLRVKNLTDYELLKLTYHYLTAFLDVLSTLSSTIFVYTGTRLNKSPYADSYWFLYSAKTTYYTPRNIEKY